VADIRSVTPLFAVAPQLSVQDMAEVAAAGFRTVIANRPDHETPDQMSLAEAKQAAEAAGMAFVAIPFAGAPTMEQVEDTAGTLETAATPVLAYCRSGTRSVTVWAYAEAAAGRLRPDELIGLAGKAGYDLAALRPVMERLAQG
jgi:uncharacterized protein (TIGR01244 family)